MKNIIKKISSYALYIAFLQAWAAILGSLYFSQIKHYLPCELCWYQRIFMYPLAIILGVAIFRKDKNIAYYVLPISLLGLAVAVYHFLLQTTSLADNVPVSCSAYGPCREVQALLLGFVTIPLLSAASFAVICAMMVIIIKTNKK